MFCTKRDLEPFERDRFRNKAESKTFFLHLAVLSQFFLPLYLLNQSFLIKLFLVDPLFLPNWIQIFEPFLRGNGKETNLDHFFLKNVEWLQFIHAGLLQTTQEKQQRTAEVGRDYEDMQCQMEGKWDIRWVLKCLLIQHAAARLIGWLIDWLCVWLVGWSVDWLIDWFVGWLIDWLIDWLIGCVFDWLIDWLVCWLIDWFSWISTVLFFAYSLISCNGLWLLADVGRWRQEEVQ